MKNAIVTGATKGIGLAIAKMLLNEGYHVTVTYGHDAASYKRLEERYAKLASVVL